MGTRLAIFIACYVARAGEGLGTRLAERGEGLGTRLVKRHFYKRLATGIRPSSFEPETRTDHSITYMYVT